MPAQTAGLNTSVVAQSTTALPISVNISRVPVSQAAGGQQREPGPAQPGGAAAVAERVRRSRAAPRAVSTAVECRPGRLVHGSSVAHRVRGPSPSVGHAIAWHVGRSEGARIPDPGFADDDGAADPALARGAGGVRRGDPATYADLLWPAAGLPAAGAGGRGPRRGGARRARAGPRQVQRHGGGADDRRRTAARRCWPSPGSAPLAGWDPDARPVPVPRAARGPGGGAGRRRRPWWSTWPARSGVAVEGDDLRALAAGWQLARVGERAGWIRPAGE